MAVSARTRLWRSSRAVDSGPRRRRLPTCGPCVGGAAAPSQPYGDDRAGRDHCGTSGEPAKARSTPPTADGQRRPASLCSTPPDPPVNDRGWCHPRRALQTSGAQLTFDDLRPARDDVHWFARDVADHRPQLNHRLWAALRPAATTVTVRGRPHGPPHRNRFDLAFLEVIEKHKVEPVYTAPRDSCLHEERPRGFPIIRQWGSIAHPGTVGEPINPEPDLVSGR